MSLAIAWQYFNAVAEGRDDYAKTFLIIAPNVIVFERLRTDFEGGRIFRTRPDHPAGAAHLLGLRLLHARRRRAGQLAGRALPDQHPAVLRAAGSADDDEPDVMTAVLGPKPPANDCEVEDFDDRIAARGGPCARPQRRGPPHPRRGQRVEQGHPPAARRDARRAGRAARLHGHAALQQGRPLLLDRLRLPAQAGHHRRRRQAADEGHRRRASTSSRPTSPASSTRPTSRPASSAGRSTASSSSRSARSRSCSS